MPEHPVENTMTETELKKKTGKFIYKKTRKQEIIDALFNFSTIDF